ncbi:MAG: exonuclease domain-containing protein [Candidatus Paceibacterota bacterium]
MIVLDVETTGLDPRRASIVSIGAVCLSEPDRQFYGECRVFDGAEVDPAALGINGFSEEEVRDESKPSDGELAVQFKEWLDESGSYLFGGLNHHLDLLFLMESAKRGGGEIGREKGGVVPKRIVDLHAVCYGHMAEKGRKVQVDEAGRSGLSSHLIYKYVGIPVEPNPHNALNGAKWEAESLSRLLYSKGLLDEFKEYPIPWLESVREIE